jgi:hypothetical protein
MASALLLALTGQVSQYLTVHPALLQPTLGLVLALELNMLTPLLCLLVMATALLLVLIVLLLL